VLTLKRGPWDDDDYDVYDGERKIGRIMLLPVAPTAHPWSGRLRRAYDSKRECLLT
jgi:hypothetical protein